FTGRSLGTAHVDLADARPTDLACGHGCTSGVGSWAGSGRRRVGCRAGERVRRALRAASTRQRVRALRTTRMTAVTTASTMATVPPTTSRFEPSSGAGVGAAVADGAGVVGASDVGASVVGASLVGAADVSAGAVDGAAAV